MICKLFSSQGLTFFPTPKTSGFKVLRYVPTMQGIPEPHTEPFKPTCPLLIHSFSLCIYTPFSSVPGPFLRLLVIHLLVVLFGQWLFLRFYSLLLSCVCYFVLLLIKVCYCSLKIAAFRYCLNQSLLQPLLTIYFLKIYRYYI